MGKIIPVMENIRAKSQSQQHSWIIKRKAGGDCSCSRVSKAGVPRTYVIEVLKSGGKVIE